MEGSNASAEHWSSWDGKPFTKTSGKHVSVYELATG
jgi:hypothetical protein